MSTVGAEGPTVSLSFANNFWGKDDAGVGPLLERMHNAKISNDEVKAFYAARANIEEEYSRKLIALAKKPLGSLESGSLRTSLDVVRGELDSMGKSHQSIAAQIKSELEEPLAAFAGAMKERRKIVQGGIEKLHKVKMQQTNTVNKTRDRYEQDCLRIKGYLAQGHMVMGQEERKNKAKLEKTQIQVSASSAEYDTAVKSVEETTGKWNREWKAACDKFQDLEEERIDFMKSSLWSFANITSTVCVTDDASCEKIRLSLEQCEVEKDIAFFIKEKGTGQEIPDPPKKLNFCRGDTESEMSEDEGYSVAQFQRSMNPTYRSSSPNPSQNGSIAPSDAGMKPELQLETAPAYNTSAPPQGLTPTDQRIKNLPYRGQPQVQDEEPVQPGRHQVQGSPMPRQIEQGRQAQQIQHGRHPQQVEHRKSQQIEHRQPQQLEYHSGNEQNMVANRSSYHENSPNSSAVYYRGPPSDLSSNASRSRPVSRDAGSEVSNPTSMSSIGDSMYGNSRTSSPTKVVKKDAAPSAIEDKASSRRKSGFFQGHSPFRRKSRHEKESNSKSSTPTKGSWTGPMRQAESPEPVQPGANFQLNVGNNVFDVAHPDKTPKNRSPAASKGDIENDPIALALAELNGSKLSSQRMSADHYTGMGNPPQFASSDIAAAKRGTPPPQYDNSVKRLDLPQPAFTKSSMEKTSRMYAEQMQNVLGSASTPDLLRKDEGQYGSRGRASGRSPRESSYMGNNRPRDHSQTPTKRMTDPHFQNRPASQISMRRSASPQPYHAQQSGGYGEMQLAVSPSQENWEQPRGRAGNGHGGRPQSIYNGQQGGGHDMRVEPHQGSHARSKSVASARQFSRDGRPILYYAKALYSYTAAIPVELSFVKGDVVAVLRTQDDGWWEGEVVGSQVRPGLVPSNYLQYLRGDDRS